MSSEAHTCVHNLIVEPAQLHKHTLNPLHNLSQLHTLHPLDQLGKTPWLTRPVLPRQAEVRLMSRLDHRCIRVVGVPPGGRIG